MGDFQTAVTWLNHFGHSNMNDATQFLIDRYKRAVTDGTETDQQVTMVETLAEASRDAGVAGEVLISIAEQRFRDKQYRLAWMGLQKAVVIYKVEMERQWSSAALRHLWVAQWLCGWTAWMMHKNYTAFKIWLMAREDLEKLIQNSADEDKADQESWYKARFMDMEIELACRVEEAYTWLNEYPEQNVRVRRPALKKKIDRIYDVNDGESVLNITGCSLMKDDLIRQRNKIVGEIIRVEALQLKQDGGGNGSYDVAGNLIDELFDALELRSDYGERAEALLECGLAEHQTQDDKQAEQYFQLAVSNYPPGSHKKAVARWMHGIIRTQPGIASARAFDDFQKAINEMQALKTRADLANNKPLVDWYAHKLEILPKSMELIKSRM